MRIVAGRLGGRPLKGPASDRIRPTSDRLRERLFNILDHGYGGVEGARVIDLFAGTGALAFEALSRGARFALLVDDGAEARAAIRDNVESLGLGGSTRVFRRDARRLGIAPAGEPFDLAFLDPPYARALAEPALAALRDGAWLRAGATVVVEESARAALVPPAGYAFAEERTFGDTRVSILRVDTRGWPQGTPRKAEPPERTANARTPRATPSGDGGPGRRRGAEAGLRTRGAAPASSDDGRHPRAGDAGGTP